MNELKDIVSMNIIMAEALNMEKQEATNKLEAKLNQCPAQWKQQTQRFIEVVKGNIAERDKLITKLRSLKHDYFYKDQDINEDEVNCIIAELQELDNKDVLAADMYQAVMDEEI